MNREDIIAMAQEAGFREPNPHDGCMGIAYDYRDSSDTGASLERFAALVASAERERFADECIDLVASYGGPVDLEAAIRARGQA